MLSGQLATQAGKPGIGMLSQPYKTPGTQKKKKKKEGYFQIQREVGMWIHMKQYILQVQGCCPVWGFMALNPEMQKQWHMTERTGPDPQENVEGQI